MHIDSGIDEISEVGPVPQVAGAAVNLVDHNAVACSLWRARTWPVRRSRGWVALEDRR
jgi:hypothetical protein